MAGYKIFWDRDYTDNEVFHDLDEAIAIAKDMIEEFRWDANRDGTTDTGIWVGVLSPNGDYEVAEGSPDSVLEPEEPPCPHPDGHSWVQKGQTWGSRGNGVYYTDECEHCGTVCHTDTAHDNGWCDGQTMRWQQYEVVGGWDNFDIEQIRIDMASNPHTDDAALLKFASDTDEEVRKAVARNTSAPDKALVLLAEDEDEDVRAAAQANPNIPTDIGRVRFQVERTGCAYS